MTDDRHPLDMLTPGEVRRGVEVIRASGRVDPSALFAHVVLDEPTKEALARWQPGDPADRRVRVLVVPGPTLDMVEATVAVDAGEIVGWETIEGMRPALLFTEWFRVLPVIKAHPEYVAAMARRGVTDLTNVQLDPWPVGSFGFDTSDDRRMARALSFVRDEPRANGYGRPVEGLFVDVDLGRTQVVDVVDHGVVPLPSPPVSYLGEDQPSLREDVRPIAISQPDGPSFVADGGLVRWQKWRFRVGFDHYEGLVLHQVAYDDDVAGRTRSILHRASVTEMVVPYGDPSPLHGWKNAFDAGEFGLGRLANSLQLGCDCVGEIRYFDATMADEQGRPVVIENAICMHEEDYGILWKHTDQHSGRTEVRRSRRLVVSFVATVGNYEYGFFWYFYLDGTIQLEVKLTGIVSPMAVDDGLVSEFANLVAPGVAAPHHQHLFSARLDFDVDGPVNVVEEVEAEPVPGGADNPWANAFRLRATRLETELAARRDIDPLRSRSWRISNPGVRNGLGRPVAYKLVPGSTPVMLADAGSPVAQRAGFARHNLWVTAYAEGERRAAGEFPNQHRGGDGLPRWTAADRSIVDTDVVCWHTFGVTHFARPEDWPVMPVEYCGFTLAPVGFFDRNPTLDVPPSEPASCHAT
ncbi:MAG TPA: primary-amine oxidase [Acidimicrobiales bacterium]|nr:primary-amine oxidase [Acidimicrobiales bacterium]